MAATIQEYANVGTGSYHGLTDTTGYGERFRPLNSFQLGQFKWKGFHHQNPPYDGYVRIHVCACNSLGYIIGSELGYRDFPIPSMPSYPSSAWFTVDFTASNIVLSASGYYLFYIHRVPGSGGLPYVYEIGGDIYTRGVQFQLSTVPPTTGGGFTGATDFMFEIWGQTVKSLTTGTVTPGEETASGPATTSGPADAVDEYGWEWGEVLATYVADETAVGDPGASYATTLTPLEPAHWYYARPKAHLTAYNWIYGVEALFQSLWDTTLVKYDSQETGASLNDIYGATWLCKTFTVSFGHKFKGVKIFIYRYGTFASGTLYCDLYATSGGKPTGSALATANMPLVQITSSSSGAWYEFGFGDGVTVNGSTMYAIVVHTPSGTYPSPVVRWFRGTGHAGSGWQSTDSGATWPTERGDFQFQEWGTSGVETYPADEITAFTAQGNGFFYDFANIDEVGFEWSDGGFPWGGTYPNSVTQAVTPDSAGYFGMTMTGLTAIMTYYYRAKIHSTVYGWLYGNQQTFMTTPPTPGVRTDPPTDAETDHIDAVGYIVWIGASNCTRRGFVYGLTSHGDPGDTDPADCLYDDYVEESGDYGVGSFTKILPNLVAGKIYYLRAWAENPYGLDYGEEIQVITNHNVNILWPTSDISKGIRCDTGPGGHWPHRLTGGEVRTPHYLLMRGRDSAYSSLGTFGSLTGKYIYERDDYNDDLYTDIFGLSNPYRRDEGVLKIKWKGFALSNSYGFGEHYRILYIGTTTYTGSLFSANNIDNHVELFALNPATSAAWSIAALDGLGAGIKLGKGGGWGTPALDWLRVDVLWANAAVVTDGVSNYVGTAARLNGHITEDEGCPCTVYFQWGLTTAYGTTTAEQAGYHIGDAFSQDITGLTETAKYHYRAVIKTDAGEIFYGADMVFPSPSYAGVWLGTEADPFQKEITNTVLGFRTERGRDEELGHAASGIAELTCDNDGGDYSPERTDGLYVGYLYVGAYLTILDELDDIVYYMFSGRIDSIEPFPEPDNRYAYILAVDGGDDLEVAEIETPLRAATDEAVLVADVLDAAGWSAGKRSIDAGVDTLQLGWFHDIDAREAINQLEEATRGFFCVDTEGNAIWQSRHYRVTGARLTSQFTFNETFLKVGYKWSKKNVKNRAKVTGSQYVEWDDDSTLWYAPANFAGAPFIPAGATVNIWASLDGPRSSSDALVKGTHWNANSQYDKSGDDLSDDITVTPTYYGQAIKFVVANAGEHDAYLVPPDSPPSGAPGNATLLVIGKIYEASEFTVVEEDTPSQTTYGKRTITVEARFKSNYNDIQSYAQNLVALLKAPLPTPVTAQFNAWTDYPSNVLKLQALTRKLSDRVTGISAHLGVNQDYYIDKIIHEYVVNEGSWVHLCSFVLSRAEGQAEGQFWILGEVGFSELGETTILGF